MERVLFVLPLIFIVFLIVLCFLLLGYWWRAQRKPSPAHEKRADTKIIDGTVFTIMGLLIAFTFSGANTRLEESRNLIIQEGDSMMIVYFALEILPQKLREGAYRDLKAYASSRVKYSKLFLDAEAMDAEQKNYRQLQKNIWAKVLLFCDQKDSPESCQSLRSSTLDMFRLEGENVMSRHLHPPRIIYVFLFSIILLGALLAGYNVTGHLREIIIHLCFFAVLMSIMVFLIVNLEFPRAGWFNQAIFNNFDTALVEVNKVLPDNQ